MVSVLLSTREDTRWFLQAGAKSVPVLHIVDEGVPEDGQHEDGRDGSRDDGVLLDDDILHSEIHRVDKLCLCPPYYANTFANPRRSLFLLACSTEQRRLGVGPLRMNALTMDLPANRLVRQPEDLPWDTLMLFQYVSGLRKVMTRECPLSQNCLICH